MSMNSYWSVVGQVGGIDHVDQGHDGTARQLYRIKIAHNRYRNGVKEKNGTVWLPCYCKFKPKCEVGDTVIARGVFDPSEGEQGFAMFCKTLGVVTRADDGRSR